MKKKKYDPWVPFRRQVLRTLKEFLSPPLNEGDTVAVETVTGARVEGVVQQASILGITVDTHGGRKSVAVYIPMGAIDVLVIEPMSMLTEGKPEPGEPEDDDKPDTDPDLPPVPEDEGAPDAAVDLP